MPVRGRPFQPGNKHGRGRPRGSRNKKRVEVQQLLNEWAMSIARKGIKVALEGDTAVLRLLLDRILPARRPVPVQVGALPTSTAAEISRSSEKVVHKVASGELAIPEGEGFLNLLDTRRRTIETEQLEERIASLESKS